jgi:hypothetical protein
MRERGFARGSVGLLAALLVLAGGTVGAGAGAKGVPALIEPDFRISGPAAVGGWHTEVAVAWNATDDEYLVVWEDQRELDLLTSEVYARRVGADGTPLGTDIQLTGPGSVLSVGQPAVAWNGARNEYLVVWSDFRTCATGGPGSNIWGRRVGSGGNLIGRNLRISGGPANEVDPAVAWNADADEYLVVWEDDRHGPWEGAPPPVDGWEVYGRRLAGDATRIGGWIRVSGPTGIEQCPDPLTDCMPDPRVVWNAAESEYLVVWQDGRHEDTRGRDILGRRVGADGAKMGGSLRVSGRAAVGDEGAPALAWNAADNEYLVAWHDERDSGQGADIYARRIGADGTRLGRERRVSGPTATGDEWFAAVAWDGASNQYLLVWEDERDWDILRWEIYGRLLAADGTPSGSDVRIDSLVAGALDDQLRPAAGFNSTGGEYLVIWRDYRDAPAGPQVYGRRITG